MSGEVNALIVEDSRFFVESVRSSLTEPRNWQFALTFCHDLNGVIQELKERAFDVILLDLTLPDSEGLGTFEALKPHADGTPIVIFTSQDDEALTLKAIEQGAADYLIKGEINSAWLQRSLVYAVQRRRAQIAAAEVESEPVEEPASTSQISLMVEPARPEDGVVVARFGEKRLVSAVLLDQVKERLGRLTTQASCQELHLDFDNVEYIANTAFAVLIALQKKAARNNKRVVLLNITSSVKSQFSSRRFDRLFEFEGSA